MNTVVSESGAFADTPAEALLAPQRDRYAGFARWTAAVICGAVAGVLLVNSMQVGVALGLAESLREWDVLMWGDHWMWRGVASVAATTAAAFIAGMIARRRGQLIGALSAVPGALYWALVAYAGWVGHIPATSTTTDVPLGYRIVAILLALGTVPCGAAFGREGARVGSVVDRVAQGDGLGECRPCLGRRQPQIGDQDDRSQFRCSIEPQDSVAERKREPTDDGRGCVIRMPLQLDGQVQYIVGVEVQMQHPIGQHDAGNTRRCGRPKATLQRDTVHAV